MVNKDVAVAFLCFAVAVSMGYTLYQQQITIQRQEDDMVIIEDHLEGLYTNSARENARTYTIMDTIIRIFHYTKPHKGPIRGCPECSDIMKKSGEKKKVVIPKVKIKTAVKAGTETIILATALQNIHNHAVLRDSTILQQILRVQHKFKMHEQKVKMCPDCIAPQGNQKNLVAQ
jgi:hypothetical protein